MLATARLNTPQRVAAVIAATTLGTVALVAPASAQAAFSSTQAAPASTHGTASAHAATASAQAATASTHGTSTHAATASANAASGMVLTPYGLVPKSKVVQVDNHQTLEVVDGQVEKIDTRTHAVLASLGASAAGSSAAADPYREAAALRAAAGLPDTRQNGTDLGGNCPSDGSQDNIQSFDTTWVVPPAPSDSTSTVTYFIWDGLDGGALQPVLQWGNGTAAYQIANWYYLDGAYAHGTYLDVSPGTSLTGEINFDSASGGTYTYTESFAGYPAADVTVNRTSVADGVIECFEPYTDSAAENPDAADVAMTGIHLTDQSGYSTPSTIDWSGNSNADSTVVVSDSSSNGEVDLYYNGL